MAPRERHHNRFADEVNATAVDNSPRFKLSVNIFDRLHGVPNLRQSSPRNPPSSHPGLHEIQPPFSSRTGLQNLEVILLNTETTWRSTTDYESPTTKTWNRPSPLLAIRTNAPSTQGFTKENPATRRRDP